jgi:hypothetical protein
MTNIQELSRIRRNLAAAAEVLAPRGDPIRRLAMSRVHVDWIVQSHMPTEGMVVASAAVRDALAKLADESPETSEELTVLCRAISTLLALLDEHIRMN